MIIEKTYINGIELSKIASLHLLEQVTEGRCIFGQEGRIDCREDLETELEREGAGAIEVVAAHNFGPQAVRAKEGAAFARV